MKKHLAILVFLVLMLSMLAGCSGNTSVSTNNNESDPAAESNPGTNSSEETVEEAPAGSETEVEEAEEADKRTDLVVAIDSDVATLHPSNLSTTNEMDIESQIYDTLMRITLDGSTPPEPRIAKGYSISDDGLTYTFELRDDVTFHDGTPINGRRC